MSTRVKIDVKREPVQMLVDDLNSGKYYLPTFQRQYVWDEDDIKDLIDSLTKNYPIGTVILWKPSTSSITEIDPFSRPLLDVGKSDGKEIFYVIDGQQRLTSLLLLLNNWNIRRGGEEIAREPISYNPSNKKFYKSTRRGVDLSKLIKAFYEYDDTAISELKRTTSQDAYKEMENMIKGVLNKYPISLCILETEREDEKTFRAMAEAFIRVNKYGIRIGNLELMLSFLAGAVRGDLKERIRGLYERLYGRFEIDLQPVIRFAFSNFGLKQTQISRVEQFKRNIDKVSQYEQADVSGIFKGNDRALNLTMDLLRSELGITTSRLLPSQIALIPIAKYFYLKGIDTINELREADTKNIINWFLLTSFNGYYSSQTDTKLDKDLEVIGNSHFPWEDLLSNMKQRKAKVKIALEDIRRGLSLNVLRVQGRAHLFMLYILLVKSQADDWNGKLVGQANFSDLARHHIFPKDYLGENLELEEPETMEQHINNLANITFIHKDINSEIEDTPPDKYMGDYLESAIKHFIPSDKNLWSIDQYMTFLQYRINQIYLQGRKFFADIFE
ncbi:MAG: DUF262 domain-containing protein [Deltaproteobacteria bacterium]|nr:DUF262 domain-containing protein [Deltaproteobacteria bacterium]